MLSDAEYLAYLQVKDMHLFDSELSTNFSEINSIPKITGDSQYSDSSIIEISDMTFSDKSKTDDTNTRSLIDSSLDMNFDRKFDSILQEKPKSGLEHLEDPKISKNPESTLLEEPKIELDNNQNFNFTKNNEDMLVEGSKLDVNQNENLDFGKKNQTTLLKQSEVDPNQNEKPDLGKLLENAVAQNPNFKKKANETPCFSMQSDGTFKPVHESDMIHSEGHDLNRKIQDILRNNPESSDSRDK